MREVNYEDLELRALAHMAYQCGPRMKSVFVDREAVREMSRRHWAYDNSPRVKPSQAAVAEGVFDYAALELAVAQSFGLRHAEVAADLQRLASAQPWDPAPPLRMGPQRCLSSRETIERLVVAVPGLLPAEPYQVERALKRATMHWHDIFEQDRERVSRNLFKARLRPRGL